MLDELSRLCPIQFIEGKNENETPIEFNERWWKPRSRSLAIQYQPFKTYTISRIEIFGKTDALPQPIERPVRLYTSRDDTPSDNYVTEGKLIISAGDKYERWIIIDLNPVVVFSEWRYWIALEDYPRELNLVKTQNGVSITMATGLPWTPDERDIKYMLKFYGRVLPVT